MLTSLLGLVFLLPALTVAAGPRVRVRNGTYEGVHSTSYNQDFFLGVPFSAPPERFSAALPTKPWYGVRSATEYSPFCVGYGGDSDGKPQSEDCLTLNVIRPATIPRGKLLPVAVWIHGGGLYMGGSSRPQYNLSNIVDLSAKYKTPMIGVSIQYRLAGWGFLTSDEVIEEGVTNLGLKDQRLALQWIKENIASFGGDPNKVTIWGESAGALSVGAHLIGRGAKPEGLFRAAIAESGGPMWYGATRDPSLYTSQFNDLLATVNCTSAASPLSCLRTAPFDALNAAMRPLTWGPIIDHQVFSQLSSKSLKTGAFARVPLLIGANSDEGTGFSGSAIINTDAEFAAHVKTIHTPVNLSDATVAAILKAYPNDPAHQLPLGYTPTAADGAQYKRAATYNTDRTFAAPRRASCRAWATHGVPTYCYRFDTAPTWMPARTGVPHFQEVAWVFANTKGLGEATNPFEGAPPRYFELAEEMARRWVAFVVSGTPNDGRWKGWPEYGRGEGRCIVFEGDKEKSWVERDNYREAGMALLAEKAEEFWR
ncbi:carboxylesterase family protein [Geopyxis carbonaria]|nr:carboxylesterase family protein [Geopyxis carbonaria]